MKCNRQIIYGWKSKSQKDKGFKSIILGSIPLGESVKYNNFIESIKYMDRYEICNGEIQSQIELEYIPYMGGSDANIEVRFMCNKCHHNFAGENELPTYTDDLNSFLTKVIKEM